MARAKSSGKSTLQLHLPDGWPNLGAADEPRFRWRRYEGIDATVGVSTLREIATVEEVIAVIPASRVSMITAHVPAGSNKKIEKMLPFLIEEHVVSSPEDVYATLVRRRAPGDESLIAVVDKNWLNQACGELDVQGFEPTRTVLEGDLLNNVSSPDQWTMVRTPSGGLIHFGESHAVALDGAATDVPPSMPPIGLSIALDERAKQGIKPGQIRVFSDANLEPPDAQAWSDALGVTIVDSGPWVPEMIDARRTQGVDLLSLRREKRRSPAADWLMRLRVPVAILAIVLGLHAILTVGDWLRLRHEAATLRSEMEARYRGLFPEAKAIVDPALQLTRAMPDLRRAAGEPAATDLLPLLAQLAPRLTAQGMRPQRIRYERGQLSLEVPVRAGETRDSLEAKLRTDSLRVQVESVSNNNATVRVTAAGASSGT